MRRLIFTFILSLAGCAGVPDGITVVDDFELNRYLGTWHEIARLDHRFERGLSNVTATYSLRDDGSVKVLNRGFSTDDDEWHEAEGKAYFAVDANVGQFKVSFFGPFYGGYNVFELDRSAYQYAMVAGSSRKYLWILAREPALDADTLESLVQIARQQEFPVDELIFVDHAPRGD